MIEKRAMKTRGIIISKVSRLIDPKYKIYKGEV